MDLNNENVYPSGIRPPSNIRSPGKLFEMSAAATNARPTNVPVPANSLKRKTLVDRAGETKRAAPAPPTSRPGNAYIKATPLGDAPRETSFSSSVSSSRPASSFSTRNVSNSSHSSSVGPSSRLPSAYSSRPQSSIGHSRIQRPAYGQGRPATSLEVHQEEPIRSRSGGKQKCRTPFSSCFQTPYEDLQPSRVRNTHVIRSKGEDVQKSLCNGIIKGREASISTQMNALSLEEIAKAIPETTKEHSVPIADVPLIMPQTPSFIPKRVPRVTLPLETPCPTKAPRKSPRKPDQLPMFLNRETNIRVAWDTDTRLEELENQHAQFKEEIGRATSQSTSLQETMQVYKLRINELETIRSQLTASNGALQIDLDATRARLTTSSEALEDSKRYHKNDLEDLERLHRRKLEDAQHEVEVENRRLIRENADRLEELRRTLESSLEDERLRHQKQIRELEAEGSTACEDSQRELEKQRTALNSTEQDLERCKADVLRERDLNNELRANISGMNCSTANLETNVQRLESHIKFLESDNKSQSQAFADLEMRMQNAIKSAAEANEKLLREETLRRRLHNQVQELKGNIRVFCRARPALPSDAVDATAKINYPDNEIDSKEIEVMGLEEKSSLGNITTKKNSFAFDRVFGPTSQNADVFGEISQLVQSALDGYNVCIFCYGQTGSGKTFTMSSSDGMIPRAVHQIYDTAKSLEEKGWKYNMEGSFIEVYNENLNDLLGKAEEIDKKKYEIKHDLQKGKTTITNIETVELDSPSRVETILSRASSNRSVAATQANERSSRSHSVFILKLIGENNVTGEKSEGTLNLVDLAGSERLGHSQATGERLKETQNINKSLSCLGDVISALGQGKESTHVPYRNSKLTYLLQNSLGGNSKTLMFVMISPLQAHLSETITSLKFATKVHNTHIGTAKRQSKA